MYMIGLILLYVSLRLMKYPPGLEVWNPQAQLCDVDIQLMIRTMTDIQSYRIQDLCSVGFDCFRRKYIVPPSYNRCPLCHFYSAQIICPFGIPMQHFFPLTYPYLLYLIHVITPVPTINKVLFSKWHIFLIEMNTISHYLKKCVKLKEDA